MCQQPSQRILSHQASSFQPARGLAVLLIIDSALSAQIAGCQDEIVSLLAEEEIPIEDRALRLEQLASSAAGIYCPEVAFDPLALRLRSIAQRVLGLPAWMRSRSAWAHLQEGLSQPLSETCCLRQAA